MARVLIIDNRSEYTDKQRKCARRRVSESTAKAQERKIDPSRWPDPQGECRWWRASIVVRC